MKPKTIILLICVALFVFILFQNMDHTEIQLLFWKIEMPLFILIISTVVLGWVLGWFSHLAFAKVRLKKKTATAPADIKDIEQGKAAPPSGTDEQNPA